MKNQLKIENQIIDAANKHLHAKTAEEALSHFTDDVIAVSNQQIFNSREELSKDIYNYYNNLKEVNLAEWEDIHVRFINDKTAAFTAKFNYRFTDIENKTAKLSGVWSALFIIEDKEWKISFRHESFSVL